MSLVRDGGCQIQLDPIASLLVGVEKNPYQYAAGNPTNYADPSGLSACWRAAAGGAVGVLGAVGAALSAQVTGPIGPAAAAGIAAGGTASVGSGVLAGFDLSDCLYDE